MTATLRAGRFFGTERSDFSCGGFAVALWRASVSGEEVPEHCHEDGHFVLALDEGYVSTADGSDPIASPGTLIYNPPGTIHRDHFGRPGGRFLAVSIPASLASGRGPGAAINIASPVMRALAMRVTGACIEAAEPALEVEDLLLTMLAELAPVSVGISPPAWLVRGVEAIADRAGETQLEVRHIAREVGVHPVHFARVHARCFGVSPGESIRQHRVARATAMVRAGRPLSDVAQAAGFSDQSHMNRSFRNALGTTPARYRAAFE